MADFSLVHVASGAHVAGWVYIGAGRFSDDIYTLPRRVEVAKCNALYRLWDRFYVFPGVDIEPGLSAGTSSVVVRFALALKMSR